MRMRRRGDEPMTGPVASYIDGDASGRLGLQHGALDLTISVDGAISLEHEAYYRHHAFALANRRFKTILDEIDAERALLECAEPAENCSPVGRVAQRMLAAVRSNASVGTLAPIAVLRGAVADEVLKAMLDGFSPDNRPRRIVVDHRGVVALHLDPGAVYAPEGQGDASSHPLAIFAKTATRGVASMTILRDDAEETIAHAANAAMAEAAATLISGSSSNAPGSIHTMGDSGAGIGQALLTAGLLHRAVLSMQGGTHFIGMEGPRDALRPDDARRYA